MKETTASLALGYLRRGLGLTRPHWRVQATILVVYATPAAVAAWLSAMAVEAGAGPAQRVAMLILPYVTAILGTVVVMMAVSHQAHGRRIGLLRASLEALPWVPRYFWTNVHTTVIFWVPVGALLLVHAWQETISREGGWVRFGVEASWGLAIVAVALTLHTRTLLAPFLAIHGDQPGTLAALEAWRLSGLRFGLCLATLIVAAGPPAALFGALALILTLTLPGHLLDMLRAAAPDLVWVAIQGIRPILIPALYSLYDDLWRAEQARRRLVGEPPVPAWARLMLALTRPLPHLGRRSSSLRTDGAAPLGHS